MAEAVWKGEERGEGEEERLLQSMGSLLEVKKIFWN